MSWAEKVSQITVGDTVCYRTSHLMAQGLMRTRLPHLSGKVISVVGDKAGIEWHADYDNTMVPVDQIVRIPERGVIP